MTLIDALAAVATDPRPWVMVGIVFALLITAGLARWQDRNKEPFKPWEK